MKHWFKQQTATLCCVPSLTDMNSCFWQAVFSVSQWTCYFYMFCSSLSKPRLYLSPSQPEVATQKVTADHLGCSDTSRQFGNRLFQTNKQTINVSIGHMGIKL